LDPGQPEEPCDQEHNAPPVYHLSHPRSHIKLRAKLRALPQFGNQLWTGVHWGLARRTGPRGLPSGRAGRGAGVRKKGQDTRRHLGA
jgi:hypothetical protein